MASVAETRQELNRLVDEWRAGWHLGTQARQARAQAWLSILDAHPVMHDQVPYDILAIARRDARGEP